MIPADALKLACERAGGQAKLARRIGTTQGQIWYWLTKSKRGVPAEFVLPIERETAVSRSDLRPDLFPVSIEEARA
jgi:DNA-binding transcriptional regulator YdaS (Cro superfamily)